MAVTGSMAVAGGMAVDGGMAIGGWAAEAIAWSMPVGGGVPIGRGAPTGAGIVPICDDAACAPVHAFGGRVSIQGTGRSQGHCWSHWNSLSSSAAGVHCRCCAWRQGRQGATS